MIKHANATEVHIGLELGSSQFTLSVVDNGRGFDTSAPVADGSEQTGSAYLLASGRTNLKRRLAGINGRLEIQSKPGHGTKVAFIVPAQL